MDELDNLLNELNLLKPYEMTFKQYCDNWLNHSIYKESYLKDNKLWEWKQIDLKFEWKRVLLERAREFPLPSKVLVSYIHQFNEADLFRTFRGVYELGIKNFRIPKKIRDLRE